MKILIAILVVVATAFNAAAADSFQASVNAAAPTHPALYSFADVYRLTVSGAAPSMGQGGTFLDSPIRVAVNQSGFSPDAQFSIVGVSQPGGWLLLLSGLVLAVWVARRRLGYFF